SVILRKSFSELCRSHADDSIIGDVIVDGSAKQFHAEHGLRERIHFTSQRTFYYQPKKVLALLASGECVARKQQVERAANRIHLLSAEFLGRFESVTCWHVGSLSHFLVPRVPLNEPNGYGVP